MTESAKEPVSDEVHRDVPLEAQGDPATGAASGTAGGVPADDDDRLIPSGSFPRRLGAVLALVYGAFHLWSGYSGGLKFVPQRAVHLGFAVAILALWVVVGETRRPSWPAKILAISGASLTVGLLGYLAVRDDWLIGLSGRLPPVYLVISAIVLVWVLWVAAQSFGWMLPAIVLGVGAFVLAAHPLSLPGASWFAPVSVPDMLHTLMYTTHGLLGSITGISAGIIASFLVFGALLNASGGSNSFLAIARFLTGRFRGGPAKVSIVTSSFFGTVSGSAIANVVVDGVFNIPLMKRSGFRPSFAAAVEAATSSGGQLVPPVMGAAAFVLAEFLGIPYTDVVIAAIVPTFLFYAALFMAIHIEAIRFDLPAMNKEDIPKARELLTFEFLGSFLVPMIVLFLALFAMGRSLLFASFAASATIILYMLFDPKLRGSGVLARVKRILVGLRFGGEDISRIVAIVIAAQLLIAILGISGIATRVTNELAGSDLPTAVALLFLGGIVILLGFGVPTVAAYILAASIAGPIFFALGIDPLAGHMFLLYMSVYANVTPPVMPAVYAAAAIARAPIMRAGFEAFRMLVPAMFIPFGFALRPELLLNRGTLMDTGVALLEILLGTGAIAAGFARHLHRPLPLHSAGFLVVGGALMAWPNTVATVVGLVMIPLGLALSRVGRGAVTGAVPTTGPGLVLGTTEAASATASGEQYESEVERYLHVFQRTEMPGLRLQLRPGDSVLVDSGAGAEAAVLHHCARKMGLVAHVTAPGVRPSPSRTHLLRAAFVDHVGDTSWLEADAPCIPASEVVLLSRSRIHAQGPLEIDPNLGRTVIYPDPEVAGRPSEGPIACHEGPEGRDGFVASVAAALRFVKTERILNGVPLTHPVGGLVTDAALHAAAVVVLPDGELDHEGFLRAVNGQGVTTLVIEASRMMPLISDLGDADDDHLGDLSAVIVVGSLTADERRAAIDHFGPILTELATTSAGFPISLLTSEEWLADTTIDGYCWSKDYELVILDAEGVPVESGEGFVGVRPRTGHDGLIGDAVTIISDRRGTRADSNGVTWAHPAPASAELP